MSVALRLLVGKCWHLNGVGHVVDRVEVRGGFKAKWKDGSRRIETFSMLGTSSRKVRCRRTCVVTRP